MAITRSGQADLPLHYGKVPRWLYERMAKIGGAIVEALVQEYGTTEVLSRLSDPFWFQSLGSVMGMDWHSSGITTSVLGALKQAINPKSEALGLYVCGGRGKYSRQTPSELLKISENKGFNGNHLVECSKLTAKIDNTAVQDGYQLYLHSFIVDTRGEWAVIQQGMNEGNRFARRYHWHSERVKSFVDEPHAAVCGNNLGLILNLTAHEASKTRQGVLDISYENPIKILDETRKMKLPEHHDVQHSDVDLKRLGTVLAVAYESKPETFEKLLLTPGLGPKTLRSLTLISEIIYGTPSRFHDPARFSFAHGGKDGHPFPVQTHVYDNSLEVLKKTIDKARIDHNDRKRALQRLHEIVVNLEKDFVPNNRFYDYVEKERRESSKFGGRTVFDNPKESKKRQRKNDDGQLRLFD